MWVFFASLFLLVLVLSVKQPTTRRKYDLERISIMRECPPAALGTGNIIFPAKIHSKSMPVVIITSEHLDGDEQENCTSCNSPFVSV